MNKKVFLFIVFIALILFLTSTKVDAHGFIKSNEYIIDNTTTNIHIYKNDRKLDTIYDAAFLDIHDKYILYNYGDAVYLYDTMSKNSKLIQDKSYNALFYENNIILESDFNSNYVCKDVVGIIKYRNCYKIYSYDNNTNTMNLLPLVGMDNYLTDVEEGYIVYNSIHNIDTYCISVCSFMNIYNFDINENKIIKEFNDIILDMSGNGYMDNNILYFESIPNIYGCNYSQIFSYDVTSSILEMITTDGDNCFHENSEIIDVNDHYLLFSSNYNNYLDRSFFNYVYSYLDDKYTTIDNECQNAAYVKIYNISISCYIDDKIKYFKIDDKPPVINKSFVYSAIRENEEKLINQLVYFDNLSSKESVKITLLNNLSKVGEQMINIKLCDRLNNCIVDEVLVDIIDTDITPPKIYCQNSITIKKNTDFDINLYGYAIDNVDGKLTLNSLITVDCSKSGNHIILVESTDSSGNTSYKEIEIVIYDDFVLKSMYFYIIILLIVLLGIIYILRFKNRIEF